jgi:hypothetical protein
VSRRIILGNGVPLNVAVLAVHEIPNVGCPGIGIRAERITLHYSHLVAAVGRIEVLGAAGGVRGLYAPTGWNAQRADACSRKGRYPPWHRTRHRAPSRPIPLQIKLKVSDIPRGVSESDWPDRLILVGRVIQANLLDEGRCPCSRKLVPYRLRQRGDALRRLQAEWIESRKWVPFDVSIRVDATAGPIGSLWMYRPVTVS